MKAHWLNYDESVLVTGTLDPAAALEHLAIEPDMRSRAEELKPRPVRGNIIPQHPEAEFRWVWYEKETGRVRAVVFE